MTPQDMSEFEAALASSDVADAKAGLTDLAEMIGHFYDQLTVNNIPEYPRDVIIREYVKVLLAPRVSLASMASMFGPRPEDD